MVEENEINNKLQFILLVTITLVIIAVIILLAVYALKQPITNGGLA